MGPDTAPPGLDPVEITPWLIEVVPGLAAPLEMERIGDGQSNITTLVTDADGRRLVLRRPPLGTRLGSAHDVVREARVLTALTDTPVPVPEILGVNETGGTDDAPVVAMSLVPGEPLQLATVAAMPTAVRRAVGPAIVATHAAVHALDIDAIGLGTLASRGPYAARQLKRWSAQWEASRTRQLPVLDELTARLTAAVPDQTETRLVHGDLHPANVLVDTSTGAVTAALDWELCTLGDPLADLGTLLAYWPHPGEPAPMGVSVSHVPGFVSRDDLVESYARLTGRDMSTVPFWHTLGLWKLAIICEGVVRRTRDDPRNRASGWVPDQATVDTLVRQAEQIATSSGI